MIKRRYLFWIFLLLFAGITSLPACMPSQSSNIPTPRVEPTVDCTSQASPRPGWEWGDIKIGVSKAADIIEELGEPEVIITLSPCTVRYAYPDNYPFFEIFNGVLNRVEVHPGHEQSMPPKYSMEGFPKTLRDAIAMYGEPEIVSFVSDDGLYVVIWDRKGVIAMVGMNSYDDKSLEDIGIMWIEYMSEDVMQIRLEELHALYEYPTGVYSKPLNLEDPWRNPLDQWKRWLPEGN